MQGAPAVSAVEGALFFPPTYGAANPARPPFTTFPAGEGALVAATGGAALGRFGWVSGRTVSNIRMSDVQSIGVVILPFASPYLNTWQRNYWDATTQTYRIRQGTEVQLLTRGATWARFAGGATPGQRVYASVVDGQAFSGYADDAQLTPWTVVGSTDPGGLALISTWAYFNGVHA